MKVGDWIVIVEESHPDEKWVGEELIGKQREIKRIDVVTGELVVWDLLIDDSGRKNEWSVAPHCARLLTPLETVLL